MTNIARAHTFESWFISNAPARIAAATSTPEGCATLFDRYPDEIWEIVAETAIEAGQDVSAWLAEYYGADLIDSFLLLKISLVRYACEKLAVELIQPMAA